MVEILHLNYENSKIDLWSRIRFAHVADSFNLATILYIK